MKNLQELRKAILFSKKCFLEKQDKSSNVK